MEKGKYSLDFNVVSGDQEQQYSDKIDFKTKAMKRDKEGHYIMIKDQSKKKI